MKLKSLLAVAILVICASFATAGPFRNRSQSCSNGQCPVASTPSCTYCNPCQCAQGVCPTGCPVQSGEYVSYKGQTFFVPAGHQLVDNGVVVFKSQSLVATSQTSHTTSQGVATGFLAPTVGGCADGKCPLVAPKANTMPKLKN